MGVGRDLYVSSGKREIYRNGYFVNEIDADKGIIALSGGRKLSVGDTIGGLNDEIMKETNPGNRRRAFQQGKAIKRDQGDFLIFYRPGSELPRLR